MAYPTDKPSGIYSLREENFAELDTNKIPMDDILFKNGYKNAEESETESVPDAHEQNWLFDILHRNLRYTMGVAEENKNLLANKVATPTTIGQIKVGYGLNITSNGVLSVEKGIAEDANIISYDLPVGSMMLWSGVNPPEYFIEPTGQTLLRANYPDLWQYAQNNNLIGDNKLFGAGDGSTTFTVADCRDQFLKIAENGRNSGSKEGEGLPNITGSFFSTISSWVSGAFYQSSGGSAGGSSASGSAGLVGFDASRSSSIYGSSTHVTPRNIAFKLILKALPTPPTNAVPVGTVMDFTGSSIPDGYIVANGAELSRTDFNRLYTWALANGLLKEQSEIPSTAHGFYGTGNGSTTFTIPDLRGVFSRYADLASNRGGADLGTYQPDGLPNITGTTRGCDDNSGEWSGAFRYWYTTGKTSGDFNGNAGQFNASWSNPIYGASNFVQPKSVSVTPILKY